MQHYSPWGPAPTLAVAVSGGVDSMVCSLLILDWIRAHGGTLHTFTVNHSLRPETAMEAQRVSEWMHGYGIAHQTLTYTGSYTPGNLQAQARDVRYRLLSDACKTHGILTLVTAHHYDDQLETSRYREHRGSTSFGMAGMAEQQILYGMHIVRPLLMLPKAELLAYARARAIPWLEDPSNYHPRFARTAHRLALENSSTREKAGRQQREAAHQRGEDEAMVNHLATISVRLHSWGFLCLFPKPYLLASPPIRKRLLSRMVQMVSGRDYPPRNSELAQADNAVREQGKTTLGGCLIVPYRGHIYIIREPAYAKRLSVTLGLHLWDVRMQVQVPPEFSSLTLAPLGEQGWKTYLAQQGKRPPSSLPACVFYGLPAFYRLEKLIAVPHLHQGTDFSLPANNTPVFVSPNPLAVHPWHWYAKK